MIRILIIDDSSFIRNQVRQLFLDQPDFHVVGEGKDGGEAVVLTRQLHPDVIIMDVEMPKMDGIQAIEQIMNEIPTPIVLHTSSTISRKRNLPFEGIGKGALDILEKPRMYPYENGQKKDFLNKLRVFAGIKVFKRSKPKVEALPVYDQPADPLIKEYIHESSSRILAIAASTGGPKALFDLFSSLPPVLPFPVVLVQHISATFVENFAAWLQHATQVNIKIAAEGEVLSANTCYLAPGPVHLTINHPGIIHLDDGPAVNSCKPSADVLFKSLKHVYGSSAAAVVLTGIGEDGANGLLALKKAGAVTMAQDKDSSVAYGMPGRARELHAQQFVGNIEELAFYIQKQFGLLR
jgi:two-component system, chemotaxis family, protein-glutamate methylesterase/glutaminase